MQSLTHKGQFSLDARFPHLMKLVGGAFAFLQQLWGICAFRWYMARSEPYFGRLMAAKQGVPRRHWYMQGIVELECLSRNGSSYRILEIGSWAGGSAITWAYAIKRFNQGNGLVICVDPWVAYIDKRRETGWRYAAMHLALRKGKIIELFIHNVRASGHEDIVRFIRGSSDEILPVLAHEQFDLVFVDGAHTYEQVSKDLKNSAALLRDGGILCGDDLELQARAIDSEHGKNNLARDYICDPKTGRQYHPGITFAVAEFFGGEVSVWEGFWAMRKCRCADGETHWETVTATRFDPVNVKVPEHLA